MNLDEILSQAGPKRPRKRIGRGIGSGHGKTSGRGHKGYGARSGSKKRPGFAGGANTLFARIPKRGFSNAQFRKDYQIVYVEDLDRFEDGQRVDPAALAEARMIQDASKPVKLLGRGELGKKVTVVADKVSASAAEKVAQAGGSVETR